MTTHSFPVLPLPRLSRNEAQARTQLAQRALGCPVELAGQSWTLDLQPWPPDGAASAPGEGDWLLRLGWGGAAFELRLPAQAGLAWLAAAQPELALPELPEAFAAAALEGALASALDALGGLQRGAARLESLSRDGTGGRELPHRFGLRLAHGDAVVHAALSTDTLGLMLMAGLVAARAPQPNAFDEDRLPVLLRATLGWTPLDADELASLEPGDTVMLEHAWLDPDAGLWLLADGFGVRARWNGQGLDVTQTATPIGLVMAETETPAPEAAQPVDLQRIPVRLSFDLGERTLTLGEVKALQVGQTLELARPLAQAVQIRANGALIGSGELVEIDGRVGVTIATLAPAGSEAA